MLVPVSMPEEKKTVIPFADDLKQIGGHKNSKEVQPRFRWGEVEDLAVDGDIVLDKATFAARHGPSAHRVVT